MSICAPRGRYVAAAAALVLLGSLVTGCSSDDRGTPGPVPSSAASRAPLPSRAQARAALLTIADVGSAFRVRTRKEATSNVGCLNVITRVRDAAPVAVKRDFEGNNVQGLPVVGNQVWAYRTADDASAALRTLSDELGGCGKVDGSAGKGTSVRLQVVTDQVRSGLTADEQLNVRAVGALVSAGLDRPYGIWFSVVRVANRLAVVGVVDLSLTLNYNLPGYARRAAENLAGLTVAG
jgi:hypothetical protein